MSKRLREEENKRNFKSPGFLTGIGMSVAAAFRYATNALGFTSETPMELESFEKSVTIEETQQIVDETRIHNNSLNHQPPRSFSVPKNAKPYQIIKSMKAQEDEDKFLLHCAMGGEFVEASENNFSTPHEDAPSVKRRTPYTPYTSSSNEKEPLYTPYKAYDFSGEPSANNLTPEESSSEETRNVTQQANIIPQVNMLKSLRDMVALYTAKNIALTEARKKRIIEETKRKERKFLTAPQEEEVKRYFKEASKDKNKIFVSINNIDIKAEDLFRISPKQWLNDELINCYMSIINDESKKPENGYPKVHCFNTFFYVMLLNNGRGYSYQRVAKWTRTFDIFALDFLIMPIHMNNNHWCLAAINFKEKRVEYYDSMGGKNTSCVNNLKSYLQDEHKSKKGSEIDLSEWTTYTPGNSIPQQDNIYDCGVFMCQFAESIASGNTIDFVRQADMPYYRKRMMLEILHNNKQFDKI